MSETIEQYAEVFDVGRALRSVGGDREFLTEVVGLTQAAWPGLLANIREGMARGDFSAVEKTARLAKAAARNVSARRAYDSAVQVEAMISRKDLPAALSAIASLERDVEMLRFCLATFADDNCPA